MPIYEYQCRNCGHIFEKITKTSDLTPPCPSCSQNNTERIVSVTSSLTGRNTPSFPDSQGHGCCGGNPGKNGCVPGSCCGKA